MVITENNLNRPRLVTTCPVGLQTRNRLEIICGEIYSDKSILTSDVVKKVYFWTLGYI